MVRLIDRPAMTIAVDLGRKATKQTNKIFIPVGYQDIHKSMDEFKFRSDPITDYGVSCP